MAKSCVMDPLVARIKRVNQSVVEPLPALVADERGSETFEALYRRTFPRVYGYVASLLQDRAAAEDVTALAFERAYRKRLSFRARRGTAEAWMFGIARNAALDELRRRKRRATLEAEPEDLESGTPEEYAELTVRREVVRAALATLEPRERDLVALKFSGGLSNAEIARVLRISESNAGTRLHRTIEKLREACDDNA
jgi:RNA polymerase sigma-70 factor, ECF subfamily